MSSSLSSGTLSRPRASAVAVDDTYLRVTLVDGREISAPLNWFDWLARATDAQRQDFRIVGNGAGIWWEGLDDGVSVPLLLGLPTDS
jgi:hypothetical protein